VSTFFLSEAIVKIPALVVSSHLERREEVDMKKLGIVMVLLVVLTTAIVARAEIIQTTLTGYEEVPVVSTNASGEFRATISHDDSSIDYELTYSGLQGTVQQGHIHIAQPSVNGSIVIWLCQTPQGTPPFTDPTGRAPQCLQQGTVTGTITTANVIAGSMAGQQLTAGDLAEVIAAMRAGTSYVNVHTSLSQGGELRGQIRASSR
jgi:CHRD domain-containing protein